MVANTGSNHTDSAGEVTPPAQQPMLLSSDIQEDAPGTAAGPPAAFGQDDINTLDADALRQLVLEQRNQIAALLEKKRHDSGEEAADDDGSEASSGTGYNNFLQFLNSSSTRLSSSLAAAAAHLTSSTSVASRENVEGAVGDITNEVDNQCGTQLETVSGTSEHGDIVAVDADDVPPNTEGLGGVDEPRDAADELLGSSVSQPTARVEQLVDNDYLPGSNANQPPSGVEQIEDREEPFVSVPTDDSGAKLKGNLASAGGTPISTATASGIEQHEDNGPPLGSHAAIAGVEYIGGDDNPHPTPPSSFALDEDVASKKISVAIAGVEHIEGDDCPNPTPQSNSTPEKDVASKKVSTTPQGTTAGIEAIEDDEPNRVDSADMQNVALQTAVADTSSINVDEDNPTDADPQPELTGSRQEDILANQNELDCEAPPVVEGAAPTAQVNEVPREDGSTILIPHAYIPEEQDNLHLAVPAEPLLPWYKQRNVRLLFVLIIALALIAIGVSFSTNRTGSTSESIRFASSSPSFSFMPSAEPSTAHPSGRPTLIPSSSQKPSASPTACSLTISKTIQTLDMPLIENDPVNGRFVLLRFEIDGRNAVVVARQGETTSVYVVFFKLDVSGAWVRNGVFIEIHEIFLNAYLWKYSVAIQGKTALVGLPQRRGRAGLVQIFDQNEDGLWEKQSKPLVPDDGGTEGGAFGHVVDLDGNFAVVGAHYEESFYVFEKLDGEWVQRLKHDVGYAIFFCYIQDNTIVGYDIYFAELHLYSLNRDTVEILQNPVVVDPDAREYGGSFSKLEATGETNRISIVRFTGKYLAYLVERGTAEGGARIWDQMEVGIYKREIGNEMYSPHQFFNSSDFEQGFGWEVIVNNDLLLISGNSNTYIFSEKDGRFEESFVLEQQAFDRVRLSGRNVLMAARDDFDKIQSLNLEDCAQPMPTLLPSMSFAPSDGSVSILPSLSPTISMPPTKTLSPSSVCHDLWVIIITTGAAESNSFEGAYITWKLYEQDSGQVLLQGGPLERNETYVNELTCLEDGVYTFDILSSRGNGFGGCEMGTCASAIWYNELEANNILGVMSGLLSSGRWYNEKFTFTLPPHPRMVTLADYTLACNNDFIFQILTDEWPEQITWELVNINGGQVVMSGGPYGEYNQIYNEWACLEYGEYNFTIYDEGPPKSLLGPAAGQYIVGINGGSDFIFSSGLDFGSSQSIVLVWEPNSAVTNNTGTKSLGSG